MAYSTQTDLENRIGATNLAQLTNDTTGAASATAAIVNALIQRADAIINGKAAQVYDTPLEEVLTGTITSSLTTLTGTGTLFLTELEIGDPVKNRVSGEIQIIASIASNTSATTVTAFATALSGSTLYRIPQIVFTMSVDLACYFAMQRRFSETGMPEDWVRVWDRIMGTPQKPGLLDQIADLEIDLGLEVASKEADIVTFDENTDNRYFDFSDSAGSF